MDKESNKMPLKANLKSVTCKNCGRKQTVKMPAAPGTYKFTCPNCSQPVPFEVKGERKVLKSDILDDRVISRQTPNKKNPANAAHVNKQQVASIPILGIPKPINGKEEQYEVEEKAVVNNRYRMNCPGCGKIILVQPHVAGKRITVICSKCGTHISFSSVDKLPEHPKPSGQGFVSPNKPLGIHMSPHQEKKNVQNPPQQQAKQPVDEGPHTVFLGEYGTGGVKKSDGGKQKPKNEHGHKPGQQVPPPINQHQGKGQVITWRDPQGMLCWKSAKVKVFAWLWKSIDSYRLLRGRNIVGRYDLKMPSNVMISGDDEMSRQSVEIMVVPKQEIHDYVYELRVLHATNPVRVNGRPVGYGKTVMLNYGDSICMGKTIISFEKSKDDRK